MTNQKFWVTNTIFSINFSFYWKYFLSYNAFQADSLSPFLQAISTHSCSLLATPLYLFSEKSQAPKKQHLSRTTIQIQLNKAKALTQKLDKEHNRRKKCSKEKVAKEAKTHCLPQLDVPQKHQANSDNTFSGPGIKLCKSWACSFSFYEPMWALLCSFSELCPPSVLYPSDGYNFSSPSSMGIPKLWGRNWWRTPTETLSI